MTREEFNTRVVPAGNKVYGFALRLLRDEDEAKDALQEVFIKLWKMRDRLDEYNSIEALCMRITKNHCLDKIKLRRTVSLENHPPADLEYRQDNPQEHLEWQEGTQRVREFLARLPEQQRMILEMRDFGGLSYEEIEEAMGLSVNTIRVNLSRARKKIKELYIQINDYGLAKGKTVAR